MFPKAPLEPAAPFNALLGLQMKTTTRQLPAHPAPPARTPPPARLAPAVYCAALLVPSTVTAFPRRPVLLAQPRACMCRSGRLAAAAPLDARRAPWTWTAARPPRVLPAARATTLLRARQGPAPRVLLAQQIMTATPRLPAWLVDQAATCPKAPLEPVARTSVVLARLTLTIAP